MEFTFSIPTKIHFGAGSLNKLTDEKLPGKKALIIISAGTAMVKFGYLNQLTAILDKTNTGYIIYNKILPNPIKEHVMEGAQTAKKNNCDMIIGLGGGSTIDAAKAIAIMCTNPGDYWDYISGGSGKGLPVENAPLPIIAITTTAGTGTESDPWTVITHNEEKIGFGLIPGTFPTISIVDPNLMLTVPPDMTAYQGFDALFHSTEGYIANISNPVSDSFALKSIELIAKWLPIAVNDGNNVEARMNVALANTISGFVESTSGCTSEHSIAHALSAYHPNLPHGAALIAISVEYYKHFITSIPEKLKDMAKAMGIDTSNMSEKDAAMAFINALIKLKEACNVADLNLADFGVIKANAMKYAKNAKDTMGGLFDVDRVEVTTKDVASIIERSL